MADVFLNDVWNRYEKGIDYLNSIDFINKTRRNHRFYSGDQWYGIKSGGEELPSLNFIQGVVKYKVTTVAQNNMNAIFNPVSTLDPTEIRACELLSRHFNKGWEIGSLDSLCRQVLKESAIQGDSYIYFGGGVDTREAQIIDNVNIFLSDEQEQNIQNQKYIIIRERVFVADVKKIARKNGVSEEDIQNIKEDNDLTYELGFTKEVDVDHLGKCISLLYMFKDDEGFVHILRCVKNLVYQEDTILRCSYNGKPTGVGLKSYPIVNFVWEDLKGSARGIGEVEFLIPNQLEVNKTIARRSISVKQTAYPLLAYASNLINNPEDLDLIGGKIAINNGNAQSIDQIISYLRPAGISPDAKTLSDEIVARSRDLVGAGDSAVGAVDPTKTSGTAIIAVRDQAQLPLSDQMTRFSKLIEDIARLFCHMWVAYNPEGVKVETEGKIEFIPPHRLEKLDVNIKIDVSKVNPFSIYVTEENLTKFLTMGHITFEEFVEALPEGGSLPKNALKNIINNRDSETTN